MFEVLFEKTVSKDELLNWIGNRTLHIYVRENRFSVLDLENLEIYKAFVVDKNHIDGLEIHVLTYNAEILVFNYETLRFITVMFARPRQAKRYCWVPKSILENAYRNVKKGLYNL